MSGSANNSISNMLLFNNVWRRSAVNNARRSMAQVYGRRSTTHGRLPTPRVSMLSLPRRYSSRATTLSDAATSMRMWRELLLISRLEASPFFLQRTLDWNMQPFQFWSSTTPPCDSRVMRGMCVALYCRVGERQCVCAVCVCVSVWCDCQTCRARGACPRRACGGDREGSV